MGNRSSSRDDSDVSVVVIALLVSFRDDNVPKETYPPNLFGDGNYPPSC